MQIDTEKMMADLVALEGVKSPVFSGFFAAARRGRAAADLSGALGWSNEHFLPASAGF